MTAFEWIRFGIAAVFMLAGLFTVFASILGTYRFKFVLNRMHSASIIDTIGLVLVVISLIIAYGFDVASLKLILIVIFIWTAGPVSSHLVSELETLTDPTLREHLQVEDWTQESEEEK